MSNKDIIYRLWLKYKMPLIDVSLNNIEDFAKKHKREFNVNPRNKDSSANPDSIISPSGFNYAIRGFIIEYCTSVGWDKNELEGTNYSSWKKYSGKKVNVIVDNSLSALDENNGAIERYDKELEIKSIKESSKPTTKSDKISKINYSPTVVSAFGYNGAIIQYKIKVENHTAEPIADIKVNLYVPDVFLVSESTKSIAMLKPSESKTVTFEIRPTGECGDCEVSGRVIYYDYATKKTTEVEIPAKGLSIVCPMLKGKEISKSAWQGVISNLVKTEESTKDLDMPAKTLFEMTSRIVKDMNMHQLEPEITDSSQLYNGVARFYGEGVKGLKYAAQVEVVGGAKKSRLILKTWAEKEEALTGFYHGLLDEIEKRVHVKGYIDNSIVQHFYHYGDNIGTQVNDSIVQRSNIGTGAGDKKCSNCNTVVDASSEFCNKCGEKLEL